MKPLSVMLIAGEPSGDLLAAELVGAVRREIQRRGASSPPAFFGAGGPNLAAAGVDLAFDLTRHAVTGLFEVLKNYFKFRRLLQQLVELAAARRPEVIVCVDFSGFNRRFATAVRRRVRAQAGGGSRWNPRLVQYVSPQVWASRPGRARKLARACDLLLTIFPFEQAWYAERVPGFRVEFVGHPIVDRHANTERGAPEAGSPEVVLLPGSRVGELKRHLPVLLGTWRLLLAARPGLRARMILPDEGLAEVARSLAAPEAPPAGLVFQVGGLAEALRSAAVAIASTGTVTMECAFFGVPTVALYKTSWGTYQIARRLVRVKFLAMPNLLAGELVFPEFIQHAATPENLAQAALPLMENQTRRRLIREKLAAIVAGLGDPGASERAAKAVLALVESA